MIFVVKEGDLFKYDGHFGYYNQLLYFMQRLANPIIPLSTEEEVIEFLNE